MARHTGDDTVNALVADKPAGGRFLAWNSMPGEGATITYSFMSRAPDYGDAGDKHGFVPFTEHMKTLARAALAQWSAAANLTFVEVEDDGDGGQIRFGRNHQTGSLLGYAHYPPPGGNPENGLRDPNPGLNDQPNHVTGNAGANRIESGGGADTVSGAAADDLIYGNKGADVLSGGGDQDSLFGGQDDDLVYGNRGQDLAYGNKGADRLFGGQDHDTVYGGQAADVIYGNKADDHIFGNRDNDILFGGQGDDWIDGGSGDDRLKGDRGNDTLAGGGGADRFEFGGQSGHDVVTDFTASEDHLDFSAPVTATTSAAGHLLLVHAGGSVEIIGESLESWSTSAGAWLV